jgi:hypothetical protein
MIVEISTLATQLAYHVLNQPALQPQPGSIYRLLMGEYIGIIEFNFHTFNKLLLLE